MSETATLYERSSRIGYTVGSFHMPEVIAERGEGARIYDAAGRSFIDYLLGSGPALLGYAHPEVNAAMVEQIGRGTHFYVLNRQAIELGEKLCEIIPCAQEAKFLLSGSEATQHSLRMVRAFTGKKKVMKFEGSFHGTNDYSMMSAFTPSKGYPRPEPDSVGIPEEFQDLVLVAPWNDLDTFRKILSEHAHELAAVICEPVQRIIPPAPGFLEAVRELTREYGVILIFDEMVTGFRMGLGGAQAVYGVIPDLAIFGKALTNGLPMTTIVGRADILDVARPQAERTGNGPAIFYGGTLNGNALSAAAALAVIKVLERPGTYENLAATTSRIREGLAASAARHGLPFKAVGVDTFFHVYFKDQPVNNLRESMAAMSPLNALFQKECVKRGVLHHRGKFYFSTVLTEADIAETLQVFDDAMAAMAAQA